MKILKNIGIYYIILTALSFVLSWFAVLYLFLPLLPFFVLGIVFLVIYYLRNKKYDKKIEENKWLIKYKESIYFVLFFLPITFYIGLFWYVGRPYNQRIVLPEGYEGVVAVQYNQPDGQKEKWIGGFLGIGADRLIEVDNTGIAKTQFTFKSNGLPFLGGQYYRSDGLKIVYKNDIDREIVEGTDKRYIDGYKNKDPEKPSIYFTDYKYYPLIIFIIVKDKNYTKYLLSEKEKEILKKDPSYFLLHPDDNIFREEILEQYYKLDPNYNSN